MKKNKVIIIFFVLCISFFVSNYSFSQVVNDTTSIESQLDTKYNQENPNKDEDNNRVFTIVEKMPEFPGGMEALSRYLMENIKYPQLAREEGIQGKVYATFVVNIDGKISNIQILRGIGGGCDEEVLRLIKKMPNWKPGKQNGKYIAVQFNLPIQFNLTEDENKNNTKNK